MNTHGKTRIVIVGGREIARLTDELELIPDNYRPPRFNLDYTPGRDQRRECPALFFSSEIGINGYLNYRQGLWLLDKHGIEYKINRA